MTMRLMRRVIVSGSVLTAVLLLAAHCSLALEPCSDIGSASGLKVLLDDFNVKNGDSTSNPDTHIFYDDLKAALKTKLDVLKNLQGPLELNIVFCKGRKPENDTDFIPNAVEVLNDDGVVVEVWGSLYVQSSEGESRPRAELAYVVVPLRHYESGSADVSGCYHASYAGKAQSHGDDFLPLFQGSEDLNVYVALGIAIKKLKGNDYSGARRYFCKAQAEMRTAWGSAPKQRDQQMLLEYTRKSASTALSASLHGSSGEILVLGGDRPCPGIGN